MSDEIDKDNGARSLISTLIFPGPDDQENVKLPTLPRNALRKLFDRPEFSPQEVYELGFRRLQRADGIGDKGLLAIVAWLKAHGLELLPPPPPPDPPPGIPKEIQQNINGAVRLLRTHGYRVQRARGKSSG